jgi:3-vinyl bacteriochlorophyllide hydratase
MSATPSTPPAARAASPTTATRTGGPARRVRKPLYTEEQRLRRNASKWTLVQGILAPLQLLVCIVSAVLVIRYLQTGDGLTAANISVLVKTAFLYTIMVTGAIWEKEIFGQYLFAEAFFWEDVVSFLVIALHTIYVWGLLTAWAPRTLMWIALAAYAVYVINAIQFLLKLRAARLAEAELAAEREAAGAALGGAREALA